MRAIVAIHDFIIVITVIVVVVVLVVDEILVTFPINLALSRFLFIVII